MPKTYVYVAGPISKGDQFVNARNGILCAERLRAAGLYPFCPHLDGVWQMLVPIGYEERMGYDFAWIERCDALFRMPGESPGADREVLYAKALGIPVFTDEAELIIWAQARQ